MLIFDISEYFILGCTLLTVATTILIVIGILNQTWHNFRFYKFYLLAYALNNCLDSVVYQFTLVFSVITRNTFVLMATGIFTGPRAIGIHLIVNQLTFIFISFLFSFRFCMHCSPNFYEFLIQKSAIVYHSLWISINALLTFSIPGLFFLPDVESIQQITALLNNMLEVPRDTGYSMTIGTYWALDTFIGLKAKPIIGLGILYFLMFMNIFWALFFTWKIVKTVRTSSWHNYSSRKYALEKQHLLSIWIQFLIAFLPLVICRLGWATVPFFIRVYYYNFINFTFGYTVLYGIPLRPVIANIALLITVREIRVSLLNCFGCSDQKITNVQSTETSQT